MTDNKDSTSIFQLIQHLTTAIVNTQLFFADHPSVNAQLEKALNDINDLTRTSPGLALTRIGGTLIINGTTYKGKHPSIPRFIELLEASSLEHVTITRGIPHRELAGFIQNIALPGKAPIKGSHHISFGSLSIPKEDARLTEQDSAGIPGDVFSGSESTVVYLDADPPAPKNRPSPGRKEQDDLERIKTVVQDLKKNEQKGAVDKLEKAILLFMKGFSHSIHPIHYLSSIKSYDEYTFVHMINVFILTTAQAGYLGFRGKHLYDIGVASILHDVGKLFIADEIINKPGALNDQEWAIMQSHAIKGARYLMGVKGISKLAIIAAMDHHIRFDGTGYPFITGWRPNLISQMITLSDAFDAMRSRRPYQAPKPHDLVLSILKKESGTAFNPFLVDCFIQLLNEPAR